MMEKRHSRSNIGLEFISSHYTTGDWRVQSGPDVVGSENHMSDAESRGICQDMVGTQNVHWKRCLHSILVC